MLVTPQSPLLGEDDLRPPVVRIRAVGRVVRMRVVSPGATVQRSRPAAVLAPIVDTSPVAAVRETARSGRSPARSPGRDVAPREAPVPARIDPVVGRSSGNLVASRQNQPRPSGS